MDWEDLRIFAAVAEHGTIRRAAKALGVHYSTVSRRLDALETQLDARLFDRTPDGYALTDAGEKTLEVVAPFAGELSALGRRIGGQNQALTGKLRVTMPEPVAVYVFAPALSEFARTYPELDLEIDMSENYLDLNRREADVAIRLDNNPPDALVGRCLYRYNKSVYASPAYLEEHDLEARPERARWIGWMDDERYPVWVQDSPFPKTPVGWQLPNPTLQVAAAQAGLGLAMLPCAMGDKAHGIVRATSEAPKPDRDVWVLTHQKLRNTARVRAFMEFACDTLLARKSAMLGETYEAPMAGAAA